MKAIQIGDEVENVEGTVNGIVYAIDDGLTSFIDEHHLRFKMRAVRKCNYYTRLERLKIIRENNIKCLSKSVKLPHAAV